MCVYVCVCVYVGFGGLPSAVPIFYDVVAGAVYMDSRLENLEGKKAIRVCDRIDKKGKFKMPYSRGLHDTHHRRFQLILDFLLYMYMWVTGATAFVTLPGNIVKNQTHNFCTGIVCVFFFFLLLFLLFFIMKTRQPSN